MCGIRGSFLTSLKNLHINEQFFLLKKIWTTFLYRCLQYKEEERKKRMAVANDWIPAFLFNCQPHDSDCGLQITFSPNTHCLHVQRGDNSRWVIGATDSSLSLL